NASIAQGRQTFALACLPSSCSMRQRLRWRLRLGISSATKIAASLRRGVVFRLCSTSGAICQPFPLHAPQGNVGALHIVDPKPLAGVLAEVEFGHVAVKMLAFNVLIGADHAALEDAEEAFQAVDVDGPALARPRIFALGMVDALVRRDRP